MKFFAVSTIALLCACASQAVSGAGAASASSSVSPSDLQFHRLAVSRFVFDNNLDLCEFKPAKVVGFSDAYAVFAPSADDKPNFVRNFDAKFEGGNFVFASDGSQRSVYMGGVNPFACYSADIEKFEAGAGREFSFGIQLGRTSLREGVRFYLRSDSNGAASLFFDEVKDGKISRSLEILKNAPKPPFELIVQLYGNAAGVFAQKDGRTSYVWHMQKGDVFGKSCDFRIKRVAAQSVFTLFAEGSGSAAVSGAKEFLSAGVGQADLRAVKYSDLSPYMEGGRLWFTFSMRGLYTAQSAQGVLSFDPSLFDVKFEGMILFDHGDGLLRNDYASQLFFDKNSRTWKAVACDFGGTKNRDDRTHTGLLFAECVRNPLRGVSVMNAYRAEPRTISGHNEDPSLYYDKSAKKYRLLTSKFAEKNIVCAVYESDNWDGPFTEIHTQPDMNSTGTSICEIGGKPYCLMGGNGRGCDGKLKYSPNLRIHRYPSLEYLGDLNLDLPPSAPNPPGRVWADVITLPDGYPYKYVLLTMDRVNFPDVKGANWSYGTLYFFGALPPDGEP